MKTEYMIPTAKGVSESELRRICAEKSEELLRVRVLGDGPSVLNMSTAAEDDIAAAAERGFTLHTVCRGMRCDDGFICYAEPELFRTEPKPAISGKANGDMTEGDSDNSLHIRPYYVRFRGDSGGWLDIVTRERWGNGVLIMPVTVKAMHNWTSHARRIDPDVFVAGVAE